MAHLITVTDLNNHEILFNLDTVVSMERGLSDQTVVTTRWGRTEIKETLSEIRNLVNPSRKKDHDEHIMEMDMKYWNSAKGE
jgi:hypothetical protein